MTPQEWAERTAQAQGLPPKVADPPALRRIAVLLTPSRGDTDRREVRRAAA